MDHHNLVRGALTAGGTGNVTFAASASGKARPLSILPTGWSGGIRFDDPNGVDWELSMCTALGNNVFSRDKLLHSSTGSAVNLSVGSIGQHLVVAQQLNAFVSRASITGVYAVGEILTAVYPTDVVGTIQFTRNMLAAPYTKSTIDGAVANGVNSLTYKITSADAGFGIGILCSNQVSSVTGGSVPAAAAALTPAFRSIFTVELNATDTTYAGRVVYRDSKRTALTIRNPNGRPIQYCRSTAVNGTRNPVGPYTQLPAGQEIYVTADTNQFWIQPYVYTTTALTSSGNTATATVPNHGLVTGDTCVIYNANPSTYRTTAAITVIDANTFTYPTATADLGAATQQAYVAVSGLIAEVEIQGDI